MSQGQRYPRELAFEKARNVVERLRPYCQLDREGEPMIAIAGSIRRMKDEVGDIEIVACPRRQADLFGGTREGADEISRLLNESKMPLLKNGPKLKVFELGLPEVFPLRDDGTRHRIKVDLYLASYDSYGWRLVLSTGSLDFGKWLVTPRKYGGARPEGLVSLGSTLFRDGEPLATPDEMSALELFELPYIPPHRRSDKADWMAFLQEQKHDKAS